MEIRERIFHVPKKTCITHVVAVINSDPSLNLKNIDDHSILIDKIASSSFPTSIVHAGLLFEAIGKEDTKITYEVEKKTQEILIYISAITWVLLLLVAIGGFSIPCYLYSKGIITGFELNETIRNSFYFLFFVAIFVSTVGVAPIWRYFQFRSNQNTLFRFLMISFEELEENVLNQAEYDRWK